ncbi:MAG: aminotransferase class V-fold PLP-dependent enzyme [Acidobacteria bacterium]|nr:aminotransferase class V-fold PLP-dependent enzyme [Acidobacteriota bacterium]
MSGRIYLDHNATAPPAPGIAELLGRLWAEGWGNPSSVHAEGRRARALLETARAQVAAAAGAAPGEVVFCSGGSEADALALRGLVEAGEVDALVIGALEHPAVSATARRLAAAHGLPLTVVPATREGVIEPAAVAAALRGTRRALVAVMLAQNEIGTLNDAAAIAEVAHAEGAVLLVDAVQAFGKLPLDFRALGADLLAISAHKIGGPPGSGALLVRPGRVLTPFCAGGGQESDRRPGTEALPLAVAFGAAAECVAARVAAAPAVGARRDRFEAELQRRVPGTRIAGAPAVRLPNTSALVFEGRDGRAVAAACDARGLAVSAGSACHSGRGGPSAVMLALCFEPRWQAGLVRVSLGPETSDHELARAVEILAEAAGEAA